MNSIDTDLALWALHLTAEADRWQKMSSINGWRCQKVVSARGEAAREQARRITQLCGAEGHEIGRDP
jgi:hypothetical protein